MSKRNKMIAVSLCFFILLQVSTLQRYFDNISSEQFIIILYLFNILLIVCILEHVLISSRSVTTENKSVLTSLSDIRYGLIRDKNPLLQKDRNLYIEWWKKRFLDQTQSFPLDRLAYISAKHYRCSNDTCILLKASQIKQLVKKSYRPDDVYSYEKFYEDPHPTKLVGDLSRYYIHRRAEFYRKRDVCSCQSKQITIRGKKKRIFAFEDESDTEEESSPSVIDKISEAFTKVRSTFSQESDDDSTDDDEKAKPKSLWRKISSAFSSKSSSRKTSSDESNDST